MDGWNVLKNKNYGLYFICNFFYEGGRYVSKKDENNLGIYFFFVKKKSMLKEEKDDNWGYFFG